MNNKFLLAGLGLAATMNLGVVHAAPALQHVDGLLVLPNTKIINKPMGAETSRISSQNRGQNVRTFAGSNGDGVTAEPTQREINALAAKSDAMRAGDRAKSAFTPNIVRTADGRIEGVRVSDLEDDGDLTPYSVVRREADGSLRYMCVQGHVHAEKFIASKAKGARNDR